jgi:antitoxin component YwqK of YwqJK toxin-antitoxin module
MKTKPSSKPPQDGSHKELFADGTLAAAGKYAKGKKTGVWKYYLRNGQLRAVGKYANGALEGRGSGTARTAC